MSHPQDRAIPMPYTSKLLNKIEPGQTLVVHGQVLTGANRFAINLLNDCVEINPHMGSVPLHIDIRFDEGKIVLNSFLGSEWGKEERHKNPFSPEQPFDVRIRVHDDKFEISANHVHIADFKHRQGYDTIDHLQVVGDVTLTGVHWGGRYFQVPLETSFHGHALRPGQKVYIYGIPKGDFNVNFVGATDDMLFHFNPRFSETQVVRNSQINGDWGNEEREGKFPFKKNVSFDLAIHNEPYSIQVYLNGEHYCSYAHRANPSGDYKSLKINGELEVTGVEISN